MTEDMRQLREWIGKSETAESEIAAWPADALSATFNRDDSALTPGDALPPAWHWLYFPEVVKLSETGPDGHPARGGFMPPVPLPNRMWANNRMTFHQPLRVGERIERVSTITDVTPKTGRSGPLVFVTARHEISGENGLATVEDHTTVYRTPTSPGGQPPPAQPAPGKPTWQRTVHPTTVLLFRFSALTMNSHRIHYDRTYVTETEGYPGLLVHGPLIAILLLDLFRRMMPQATLTECRVRAMGPLYDIADFTVEGAPESGNKAKLWALDSAGSVAMMGEVKYAGS
jgi:3-methylfumaryl-CoA hydratase